MASAERVVGEGWKVVVATAAVVVATAIVGAALRHVVELVGCLACWEKEQRASFSSSEHARLSLGRASSYSDPSRIRPPSLQKHK